MVYKCSFKYEILYAENKCKNTSFNLKFYKAYVNFENIYFNPISQNPPPKKKKSQIRFYSCSASDLDPVLKNTPLQSQIF